MNELSTAKPKPGRPKQDEDTRRIVVAYSIDPKTAAKITRLAARKKVSKGVLIDALAADKRG